METKPQRHLSIIYPFLCKENLHLAEVEKFVLHQYIDQYNFLPKYQSEKYKHDGWPVFFIYNDFYGSYPAEEICDTGQYTMEVLRGATPSNQYD